MTETDYTVPPYDPRGVPGRMDDLDGQVERLTREVLTLYGLLLAVCLVMLALALRQWMAARVG